MTTANTMTTTPAVVHVSVTTTIDASTTSTGSTTTASHSETNRAAASDDVVQGQLLLEVLNSTEFLSAPVESPLADSFAQMAKVDVSAVSLRIALMSRRLGASNSSAGVVRVTYTIRATKDATMDIANRLSAMNLSATTTIINQNFGKAGLERFSMEVLALTASLMEASVPEKTNETELGLLILLVSSLFSVFAATSIAAAVCWRKWHVREQPEDPFPDAKAVELPTLFERPHHLGKLRMCANQVGEEELMEPREVDIEGLSDPVIISRV